MYFRSIEIQIHALAYSIVDPEQYLRETIHVPGGVFGQEFASTEAKKKQMFPVVVVSWDRNAKCSDHRGADLHGVVTVQDLTGYKPFELDLRHVRAEAQLLLPDGGGGKEAQG